MNRLVFLSFTLMLSTLIAFGQKKALSPEDYVISRTIGPGGDEIVGIIAPGIPPANHREPIAAPSRSTVTLANVPAYDWSFGCSATSAAMAAGYYDNNGYPLMYTGPANGGVAPMNNSTWGTVVINGETRSLCPISATMNGLDGRTTRGHVDDYWIQYNSSGNDPYITNGWTQHTYSECTGDYMGTNQSVLVNVDGSTTYYFYTNGSPLYNYTGAEPTRIDGCHGQRDFYESRGYQVLHNYSQYINGYNGNTIGFTFNQYKSQIDSGRVVLIHVTGHTMLGYGYDDATNTVYLHDTWDYNSHTMTWGGSYAGLTHYGVTVIKLGAVIDCYNMGLPYGQEFSDGETPTCWTVVDNIGNGQVWAFDNPGGLITLNTSTGNNGFAVLNSNYYGAGNSQNSDLLSPFYDLSDAMGVMLRFEHYFQAAAGSSGTLSYSINGGSTWTVIQVWTASTANASPFSIDLSDQVAGQDSVRFKWNYTGSNGYCWAVDDIEIDTDVPGLWTGAVSTDWNATGNWANGAVPGNSTNIRIHPWAENWPVLNTGLTIGTACNNLTIKDTARMTVNGNLVISAGKSLSFTGNGQLTVSGNWTDQGTFNPGTGTVIFTGSGGSTLNVEDIISNVITDYSRSTFPVGMTPLTGATLGPTGNRTSSDVPIGFSFIYMGVSYTTVRLSTSGNLVMNLSGTAGIQHNTLLFSTTAPNTSLAPWWDDLMDDGTSTVSYKTEGTAPNRVFTAEWYRVLTYATVATARISFQVKLYEASRKIEFHYGNLEGTVHNGSESASIGIEDATGGSTHYIEGTTGSSTTAVTNLKSEFNWPTVNYRFSPTSQFKSFHNIIVNKTSSNFTINGNITVLGDITVKPGSNLIVPAGKTLTISN